MEFPEIGVTASLLRGIMERRPAAPAPSAASLAREPVPPEDAGTRSGRMGAILRGLCGRPGVRGALVADADGLAVASHGGSLSPEQLAACSSLLGSALDDAGRVLESRPAERISLRLSDAETALLTRFTAEGLRFHLLVLCAPSAAERLELAQPVAVLRRALAGSNRPAAVDG